MKAQKKYKCQQIDKSKNKKSFQFDKYKNNDEYILLLSFFS